MPLLSRRGASARGGTISPQETWKLHHDSWWRRCAVWNPYYGYKCNHVWSQPICLTCKLHVWSLPLQLHLSHFLWHSSQRTNASLEQIINIHTSYYFIYTLKSFIYKKKRDFWWLPIGNQDSIVKFQSLVTIREEWTSSSSSWQSV